MKIIDIETVPQPGIMQTWFPEWAKRKMPNATDEELEQSAALHGEFGMVCAIGIADPGCSPSHVIAQSIEGEKDALVALDSVLAEKEALVGHNIKNFDIPFLAKRYLYHGLPVPHTLRTAGKKPWELVHVDTMELLRFAGDCSMSLRSACLLLGLGDPKAACSGAEVFELFKQGRFEEIGRYVESDVKYTDRVYQQLTRLAI